ncbi:MAG TPA: proton-conducting transporter membrane subunit [Kofleriaceae bacterium]|nr:proton-conducting transporter membrane subunit [Kofleriaceae bacterium]
MAGGFGLGVAAALVAGLSPRLAIWLGHLGICIGGAAGAVVAVGVLTDRSTGGLVVDLADVLPYAQLSLTIDPLSAFFLLVVSLVAVAAAIYGPAYLRVHGGGHQPGAAGAAAHVLALGLFVGSMAFLCCAGDAITFLLAWEGMTVGSYLLVVSETRNDDNVQAGLIYIVMAHLGTAMLLFVFLVLADRGGGTGFDDLRLAAAGLSDGWRTLLFFLALGGFAVKAGVVPLHVWLPYAHPAAPSHVSALMSGVMLKVALYGMLRFAFDVLAPAGAPLPASWGWTVLALGTVSAVIGVLYALQQHDLKRLLAFHSVENVGIILMGAGLAMLLARHGEAEQALATLALAAALMHTINHAAFKGLLFLCAGGVVARTHVRNMEELGGLARRMPWTAWLFLLGAVAISALPPLNGFVSEWMTFQALLGGGAHLGGAGGLFSVFAASMLALTGGLAAACFVKAFGVTFLGRPRSAHAAEAVEVPASMIVGMVILAGACVVLGVAPGYAVALLDRPTAMLLHGSGAGDVVTGHGPMVLGVSAGASIFMTGVAVLFIALAVVAWILRSWPRAAGRRAAPTWTCGFQPTSRFDYSATAFAKSLRLIFALLYRPRRQIERDSPRSPYVVERLRYSGEVVDVAETALYRRFQRMVTSTAGAIRARSTGRIHGYIGYVLVTLLIALLLFGRA